MYSQLLVAALAASVSANIVVPGHLPMRRELQNFARQTDSAAAPTGTSSGDDDYSCELALMSLASSIPTPDAALASYEATYTPTDSCSYSVPSSLSSDFVSYTSAVESWYSASSDAVSSIVSECPEYAGEASEISECPTSTGAAGSAASASATSTTGTADHSSHSASTKSSGSTSSSSATGTAAGSSSSASASGSGASGREIGIVGALLAGVLGLAVALVANGTLQVSALAATASLLLELTQPVPTPPLMLSQMMTALLAVPLPQGLVTVKFLNVMFSHTALGFELQVREATTRPYLPEV
ncbi:hypothetical protein VM1G_04323 [Cytospora mali]|uniref:Uncharacterized protein n=1 Tax=Cytospora mali TaxID=578113 RepID=A0A194VXA9_CYTMA|nr:hypothetical protein VM1G_04323 [Valsa mali]